MLIVRNIRICAGYTTDGHSRYSSSKNVIVITVCRHCILP